MRFAINFSRKNLKLFLEGLAKTFNQYNRLSLRKQAA